MAAKNMLSEFLEAYKELETTIRSNAEKLSHLSWIDGRAKFSAGTSVLDVENGITDDSVRDKLKTCRIIRNYAQHHDDADGFVGATSGMIEFIQGLTSSIRLLNGTYKDVMTKCPIAITANSNVTDCAGAFMRTGSDWYPVSDVAGSLCGIITKDDVFAMLGSGCTLKTHIKDKIASPDGVLVVKQTDPIPNNGVPKGRIVVANAKGKVTGIIH